MGNKKLLKTDFFPQSQDFTFHRVVKSRTRLKRLSMYTHTGETPEYNNPQSVSEITGINFGQPK